MAGKTKKIRPTVSNARQGKNGVFQPEHLDTEKGKAAQMNGLLATWHCYQAAGGWMAKMDFSQVEDYFYRTNFEDGLNYQNMKYKKKGNYDRIRDMDEYRESVKTCPESTLYYLGDRYHNAGADLLRLAVVAFLEWREREYPQVKTLDWALHIEDGAPHIHERHDWIAHDEAGNLIVSQEKALEEMGVPRADEAKYQADMAAAQKITDKKQRARRVSQINRYNNRKMTYSEKCRDKMIEIARSYGIEVEDQPREAGQKGLNQARFKTQDELRKQEEARKKTEEAQAAALAEGAKLQGHIWDMKKQRDGLEREIGDMTEFLAFRAQRAAQKVQEDAQASQDAQEVTQAVSAAPEAPRAPQDAARLKSEDEMLKEFRARMGYDAPPEQPRQETPPPEPPMSTTSLADMLMQISNAASRKDAGRDGPGYPGA